MASSKSAHGTDEKPVTDIKYDKIRESKIFNCMNKPESLIKRNIVLLAAFSMAMGFLEAAVVVYLRQLYYPEGFEFPLKTLVFRGFSLEYFREISTIVILFVVSLVAGRATYERFSYFLYCFGMWDIFYYVWLKALLNWPQSLLTWDVLFLIPVVWVGPVVAPLLCAATMVVYSGSMLYFQNKGYPVRFTFLVWVTMSLGIFFIVITFMRDSLKIIMQEGFPGNLSSLATDPYVQKAIAGYIPASYDWTLFALGESLMLCSLALFLGRMKKSIR
jgi:hypothetical protein